MIIWEKKCTLELRVPLLAHIYRICELYITKYPFKNSSFNRVYKLYFVV